MPQHRNSITKERRPATGVAKDEVPTHMTTKNTIFIDL